MFGWLTWLAFAAAASAPDGGVPDGGGPPGVAGPGSSGFDLRWSRVTKPAPGPALVLGQPGAGCVQGARALPLRGPGFVVARPERHRHFGHPALVAFIRKVAAQVRAEKLPVEAQLKTLVCRFMQTYRHAQAQHMVLVQDVKFLEARQRMQVQEKERQVVQAFARAIAALKPRLKGKALEVPLTMILFGMINWTFTWLRPDGRMTYEDMAQVVSEVFLHGVSGATAKADR